MIDELKPYPEYKDSGLPWLGQVPKGWGVRRIKTVLHERDARSRDGRGTLLSLTRNRGLIPHSQMTDKMHSAKTLVGYKLYRPGQIVMNRMQAWSGMFGAGAIQGLISPDYAAFDLVGDHDVRWVLERLKTPDLVGQFALESKGIGSGFNRLYTDRFGPIPVPLPPRVEQSAIVRFLDHANARIERAIRAKRKLIALLNEQKQAIIHRAVTRGLDPSVKFKPSGIPWLGDVPAHWEAWRVSRFARVGNGSTPSRAKPAFWNGGSYPWLNSSQMNRGYIDSADQFVTQVAMRECHLPKVSAGSVLVAITGQGKTRGTAAVLGFEATINQHVAYITPRVPVVTPDYLHLALSAAYQTLRALSEDSGSTKGALTCADLKRFKVVLPPSPEQVALVAHIRKETKTLEAVLARTEREIDLIREYRTTLTADVVTGKLDVREAAKCLPAVTDEPPPGDEELPEDTTEENADADE